MTRPFFSIITVVYNAEAGFERTAKSLQDQEFRDFEWIVVDGGSTDGTLDMARAFIDPARDILISEPDKGVYDAMNKGLRCARGEVVQFLNANDWFASEQVLSMISTAFKNGVDAVYGDTILSMPDGRQVVRTARVPGPSAERQMSFTHQAFFVRREVHLQHPFDIRFRISADKAVVSQMRKAGVNMVHAGLVANVNSIEPKAISIAGKARAAAEEYRINVDILGRPRAEAAYGYLRKRFVILGVQLLLALPKRIFDRLPEGIRRRVY